MKLKKTIRGFKRGEFKDADNTECSIQESSACGAYIWLGVNKVDAQFLAKDAKKVGVATDRTLGWIQYPIPPEVSLFSRMHLSQKQVKKLLPLLTHFAEHGVLP